MNLDGCCDDPESESEAEVAEKVYGHSCTWIGMPKWAQTTHKPFKSRRQEGEAFGAQPPGRYLCYVGDELV